MGERRDPNKSRQTPGGVNDGEKSLGTFGKTVRRAKIRLLEMRGWPDPEYAVDYPSMTSMHTRALDYIEDRPTFLQRKSYLSRKAGETE